MKVKPARGYKMGRLYLKKIPAENIPKRGDEIRIGMAFFKVVFQVKGWCLLECLVDWEYDKKEKNLLRI